MDWLALIALLAGVLLFSYPYWSPSAGAPIGLDVGWDLAYLEPFRDQLFSGRLLTWYGEAYDGMPLLGHPLTQIFYAFQGRVSLS